MAIKQQRAAENRGAEAARGGFPPRVALSPSKLTVPIMHHRERRQAGPFRNDHEGPQPSPAHQPVRRRRDRTG